MYDALALHYKSRVLGIAWGQLGEAILTTDPVNISSLVSIHITLWPEQYFLQQWLLQITLPGWASVTNSNWRLSRLLNRLVFEQQPDNFVSVNVMSVGGSSTIDQLMPAKQLHQRWCLVMCLRRSSIWYNNIVMKVFPLWASKYILCNRQRVHRRPGASSGRQRVHRRPWASSDRQWVHRHPWASSVIVNGFTDVREHHGLAIMHHLS